MDLKKLWRERVMVPLIVGGVLAIPSLIVSGYAYTLSHRLDIHQQLINSNIHGVEENAKQNAAEEAWKVEVDRRLDAIDKHLDKQDTKVDDIYRLLLEGKR